MTEKPRLIDLDVPASPTAGGMETAKAGVSELGAAPRLSPREGDGPLFIYTRDIRAIGVDATVIRSLLGRLGFDVYLDPDLDVIVVRRKIS